MKNTRARFDAARRRVWRRPWRPLLSGAAALTLLLAAQSAYAVPILQLFVEDGTYDSDSETWTATSEEFNVWVIGNVSGPGGQGAISHVVLAMSTVGTGSITVTPTTTSLVIDSLTIADPSTPSAPVVLADETAVATYGADLGPGTTGHDEYSTADAHYFLGLGTFSLTDSPIADFNGDSLTAADFTLNAGQINVYRIKVTGFESVHFDAFNSLAGDKHVKAPFSHDATDIPLDDNPIVVVSEPSTQMLALFGIVGFCLVGRRLRQRGAAAFT